MASYYIGNKLVEVGWLGENIHNTRLTLSVICVTIREINRRLVMSNEVFIYVLRDPRDNQIRYVGKTTDTRKRLVQHISDGEVTERKKWLVDLVSSGSLPGLEVVKTTNDGTADIEEQRVITELLAAGYDLTNVNHNENIKQRGHDIVYIHEKPSAELHTEMLINLVRKFYASGDIVFCATADDMSDDFFGWLDGDGGVFVSFSSVVKFVKKRTELNFMGLSMIALYMQLKKMGFVLSWSHSHTTILKNTGGKVRRVLHADLKLFTG